MNRKLISTHIKLCPSVRALTDGGVKSDSWTVTRLDAVDLDLGKGVILRSLPALTVVSPELASFQCVYDDDLQALGCRECQGIVP
jgi:hypothetical protein